MSYSVVAGRHDFRQCGSEISHKGRVEETDSNESSCSPLLEGMGGGSEPLGYHNLHVPQGCTSR